jgi:hypothetical protein
MQNLLFDTPWWLLLLLLVAGAALWWSGNNRRDKTLRRVGLGVVLAGVVLAVVSWYFDTDVESVSKRTRQIVQAVDKRDWNTFSSLLDQRTSLPPTFNNRDKIVEGARRAADAIGLRSVRVFRLEAQKKDTVIQVNFNVISEQDRGGGTTFTNWQFDWQNFGNGWKLDRITPVRSDTISTDQMQAALQHYR